MFLRKNIDVVAEKDVLKKQYHLGLNRLFFESRFLSETF